MQANILSLFIKNLHKDNIRMKPYFSQFFSQRLYFYFFSALLVGVITFYPEPAQAFFNVFNSKIRTLTTDLTGFVRLACVLWVVVEIFLFVVGRGNITRALLPIGGSILLSVLQQVITYFGMV